MKKIIFTLLLPILCSILAIGSEHSRSASILGDSYSTFQGYLDPDSNAIWYWSVPPEGLTDVDGVEQTWWHKVLNDNGMRLCINNSFSGSTICNTGYDKADYSDRSFITRMDNLGCPEVLFIFGGTNDSWAGVPVGEYKWNNWTPEELYTFRPAIARLLDYVTKRYVNVETYFLLNDGLSDAVTESIKEACCHYGVSLIELHDIDKINGHPSLKGMEQIATQVSAALREN